MPPRRPAAKPDPSVNGHPRPRADADARALPSPSGRRFVLGISGASGAAYATRILHLLLAGGHEVHLVATEYGRRLLHDELGIAALSAATLAPALAPWAPAIDRHRLYIHPHKDVGAVIASGSFLHDGMAVVPCSSSALGYIANGSGTNLLARAAAVTLKERRRLVIVHRETPLSLIDIRNMEALTLAGAVITPANPGFYLHPQSVADLVDFIAGKVLDLLHVPHALDTRWHSAAGSAHPPAPAAAAAAPSARTS